MEVGGKLPRSYTSQKSPNRVNSLCFMGAFHLERIEHSENKIIALSGLFDNL